MMRIIDGVLYDTAKSEFICSFWGENVYGKKSRSRWMINYYIAKNGTIFYTDKGEIKISDKSSKSHKIALSRIKPTIYAKYFPLEIPGNSKKIENQENISRLERVK